MAEISSPHKAHRCAVRVPEGAPVPEYLRDSQCMLDEDVHSLISSGRERHRVTWRVGVAGPWQHFEWVAPELGSTLAAEYGE